MSGSILVDTPPHTAGVVDVIVTNSDGQSLRLAGAYEYVAQQSFDFNGSWEGFSNDGSDIGMGFTIHNGLLIAASCEGWERRTTITLSSPATDGEFSADVDGFRISGRIVSPSDAIGRITAPACGGGDFPWVASRLPR